MMERTSAQRGQKGAGSGGPTARDFDLQRRVRKLASELENVQTDVAALSTRARATEGAVSELRLVEAWQEVRAAQRRLDEVATQLEELNRVTEKMRAQAESSRADLADALDGLTARVQRMTSRVEAMGSEIEKVDRATEEMRAHGQSSQAALADGLESLTARVGRVTTRVEGLGSRIEEVESAAEGLRVQGESSEAALGRVREMGREIRLLRRDLGDVPDLRRQVASLRRAIAELQQGEDRGTRRRARGRIDALLRSLKRAGRRVRRYLRLARRRTARAVRKARVRIMRSLRRARAKVRRGLRNVRQRFFGAHLGRLDHHPPKKLRIPRRYRRRIKLSEPPKISIVTPSLNQASFVGETIKSVLGQRYPQLEYIVQDGGSTDGTLEILERYRRSLHSCESRPDSGQAQAINRGFEHSTGEIMAYLNADDLILPGALAYVARYFQRHPKVDVVYGHRVLVDEDGMEVGRWVLPRHNNEVLSWADFVPQETLYWRRSLWEKAQIKLDEESRFALDWDLILSFRDAGARIVRLPRFLGAFRIHESQKTSAEIDTAGNREMAMIRSRVHGREVSRDEVRRHIRGYLTRHVILQKLHRARLLRY